MSRVDGHLGLGSDYRLVQNGIRPEQPRAYVFSLTRILTDLLIRAKGDHDVAPVVRFLQDNLSKSQGALQAAKVACADGCWFCCTRWVDAKAPEVLYIARGLRERPDLLSALAAGHAAVGARPYEMRKTMVTPCPMLTDQRCSIYSDRPLVCRSAVSRDATICERSFLRTNEPIPRPVVYNIVGRAYALALTVALFRAGLDHRAYEFTGALVRACQEIDAEKRWLDGEDMFSGVNRSSSDTLNDPQTQTFIRELESC